MTINLSEREAEVLRLLIADYQKRMDEDGDLDPEALSDREHEILVLLASGKSYVQIAAHCTIALSTTRSHVAAILRKMGADNARTAIAIALKSNILTLDQLAPNL